MQLTLSVPLSGLAALLSVGVGVLAWQYRDTDGAVELVWHNAGIVIWTAVQWRCTASPVG